MRIRTLLSLVLAAVVSSLAPATFAQQLLYIHADHLNTPRLVTNGSGTPVWRWDQVEPFGDNLPNEDPDGNSILGHMPLRFPGQYFDKETGLYYNYHRDYDPLIGRYVESDPIGLRGGLNTYVYAIADPLRHTDEIGLAADCKADPCLIRWQIRTTYDGYCSSTCRRMEGFIQWWTCWPNLRIREPRCVCGGSTAPRG
jgi:RHS repeat-associated protein